MDWVLAGIGPGVGVPPRGSGFAHGALENYRSTAYIFVLRNPGSPVVSLGRERFHEMRAPAAFAGGELLLSHQCNHFLGV